jgi:hypothetical protein
LTGTSKSAEWVCGSVLPGFDETEVDSVDFVGIPIARTSSKQPAWLDTRGIAITVPCWSAPTAFILPN